MRFKLEEASRLVVVEYNVWRGPLVLMEPHIGEATWVQSVYEKAMSIPRAWFGLSGDLINADDLREKGLITKEFAYEQMLEFESKFVPHANRTLFVLQNNHGTRMYGKSLPRQFGSTLVGKWEEILSGFPKETTVLKPDDSLFELHLVDGNGKTLQNGLVCHPSGVSSDDAFVRKIAANISNYDFVVLFHFHKRKVSELTDLYPNGYMGKTDIYCVPPLIENPKYGMVKYPPIDAGFLVIHKEDCPFLDKPRIRFDIIQKSDILG